MGYSALGCKESDMTEHAQIEYLVCVHAELQLTLCDTVEHRPPAPLAVGLSQQEYWSGLPFPPLGDLPDPGIKPASPALAGRLFTPEPPGNPSNILWKNKFFFFANLI